jgi:hypothetical protein
VDVAAKPLQRVQQRGLLAGDVGARAAQHLDVELDALAMQVGAQVASRPSLGHRRVQPLERGRVLRTHQDVPVLCADGQSG